MPTYNSTKETAEGRIELTVKTNGKPKTIVFLADVHNNFDYLKRVVAEIQKHPDWQEKMDSYKCKPHTHDPHHGTITEAEHLAIHGDPFHKLYDMEAEQ